MENLVCLAVPVMDIEGWSLSREGFSVMLKSPSQTAWTVGCRAINENPSRIIDMENGGWDDIGLEKERFFWIRNRPCGSVEASHSSVYRFG